MKSSEKQLKSIEINENHLNSQFRIVNMSHVQPFQEPQHIFFVQKILIRSFFCNTTIIPISFPSEKHTIMIFDGKKTMVFMIKKEKMTLCILLVPGGRVFTAGHMVARLQRLEDLPGPEVPKNQEINEKQEKTMKY